MPRFPAALRSVRAFAFASLLGMAGGPVRAYTPALPNVVLILVDDLGWADLGVNGSTFYETPNVNRLAGEGVLFTDAYAASPVCSPTRASILSGKYPSRIGMSYLAGTSGAQGPAYQLIPPDVVGNMPHEDVTLPEALREHGYATAHIGKWHLQGHGEHGDANYPEKHGFDVNIAGHRAGQPGSYHYPYASAKHSWSDVPGMEDGKEGDYLTDALTDKAIGFIEAQAGKPFYLNLWYYTVHTPIQPRPDKFRKYQEKARALGLDKTSEDAVPELHGYVSHRHQDNPSYAAMIESMDENVGRILDALARLGLEENTIVIFYSDNGGLSTGVGPRAPTSNLPLRAGKAWLYEGGIRVPGIIRYPAAARKGLKLGEPIVSTDLYPTILDLAGLPMRPEQHVDGVSLKSLLTGAEQSLDRDAIYFHLPHYHHINSMGPAGAIRRGDYKLIEVFETNEIELYNLRDDMGEENNIVLEQPGLAAEMREELHAWRDASGAKMTRVHPDYRPDEDWRKQK